MIDELASYLDDMQIPYVRSGEHDLVVVSQGIQNCCAHRQKTYKGYRWEYAEVDA